jgi:hypothetical protein
VGARVWGHARAPPADRPRLPRPRPATGGGGRHRHQLPAHRALRTYTRCVPYPAMPSTIHGHPMSSHCSSTRTLHCPPPQSSTICRQWLVHSNEAGGAHAHEQDPVESGASQSAAELESCMVLLLGCFEKLFLLDDLFAPDCAALRKAPLPPLPPRHLLLSLPVRAAPRPAAPVRCSCPHLWPRVLRIVVVVVVVVSRRWGGVCGWCPGWTRTSWPL